MSRAGVSNDDSLLDQGSDLFEATNIEDLAGRCLRALGSCEGRVTVETEERVAWVATAKEGGNLGRLTAFGDRFHAEDSGPGTNRPLTKVMGGISAVRWSM